MLVGEPGVSVPEQLNDLAVRATGDVLVITAEDVVPDGGWCQAAMPHVLRDDVGLVTGKIVYSDNRLYACGLVVGTRACAGRSHHGCNADDAGYGGWMAVDHEVTAVPWQFMAVRRDLFAECGGFDSGYQAQGFDVDLSLRLCVPDKRRHLAIPSCRLVIQRECPGLQEETWALNDISRLWTQHRRVLRMGDPFLNANFSLVNETNYIVDEQENGLRVRGVFAACCQLLHLTLP